MEELCLWPTPSYVHSREPCKLTVSDGNAQALNQASSGTVHDYW